MPAGTTFNRTPLAGSPEYAYYTSNGNVARVDGNGTVEGWANGQATIMVADASGQTASYVVIRSNAWQMAMIGTITGGRRNAGNSGLSGRLLSDTLQLGPGAGEHSRLTTGQWPTLIHLADIPHGPSPLWRTPCASGALWRAIDLSIPGGNPVKLCRQCVKLCKGFSAG